MDQIKDSTADQHQRRRTQPTKFRCFLGCFGGGGATEDEKLPQRRFKSINQSPRWFSRFTFKLRSKKSPKRTVPVESQSSTDEKANHEKGRRGLGRSKSKSKSKSNTKMIDELPAKGDDEILNQPPVAGDVPHGKANKTRSGKGKFMRNSKSMNHIELLEEEPIKQGTATSLRKSKSAKITTIISQPAGGGEIQLIRPRTAEISAEISHSQSIAEQHEITGRGEYGDDDDNNNNNNRVEKPDEKNKGSIDRVVGISIIVMVLLIMAVWGKLCAILCSSAWLYFYPLLLGANNNNGTQDNKKSDESLQLVHERDHQIS